MLNDMHPNPEGESAVISGAVQALQAPQAVAPAELRNAVLPLDLSCQELRAVPVTPTLHASLRELSLAFNMLSAIDELPDACPCLQRLNAAHNRLAALPEVPFACLERLDVSHNQLTSLGGLSGCDALTEVWVSHNRLMLPAILSLQRLERLHTLVFSGNPCERVQPAGLCRAVVVALLPQLQRLDTALVTPDLCHAAKKMLQSEQSRGGLADALGHRQALAALRVLAPHMQKVKPTSRRLSSARSGSVLSSGPCSSNGEHLALGTRYASKIDTARTSSCHFSSAGQGSAPLNSECRASSAERRASSAERRATSAEPMSMPLSSAQQLMRNGNGCTYDDQLRDDRAGDDEASEDHGTKETSDSAVCSGEICSGEFCSGEICSGEFCSGASTSAEASCSDACGKDWAAKRRTQNISGNSAAADALMRAQERLQESEAKLQAARNAVDIRADAVPLRNGRRIAPRHSASVGGIAESVAALSACSILREA